jgi:hypothetical protein
MLVDTSFFNRALVKEKNWDDTHQEKKKRKERGREREKTNNNAQ